MAYCADSNCGYYWKEEWEDFPSCKFNGIPGTAPCEIEDEADEEEDRYTLADLGSNWW